MNQQHKSKKKYLEKLPNKIHEADAIIDDAESIKQNE